MACGRAQHGRRSMDCWSQGTALPGSACTAMPSRPWGIYFMNTCVDMETTDKGKVLIKYCGTHRCSHAFNAITQKQRCMESFNPWMTESEDMGSVDTATRLYIYLGLVAAQDRDLRKRLILRRGSRKGRRQHQRCIVEGGGERASGTGNATHSCFPFRCSLESCEKALKKIKAFGLIATEQQ